MGRSKVSGGGGKAAGGPDWLGPQDAGDGDAPNRAQVREAQKEEKKRRPRRDLDDEALDKPDKKGIKMAPIILLLMMTLPALLPAVLDLVAKLQTLGIVKLPNLWGSDSKYRPCLREYYADWAPEKLGTMDDILIQYEGREKQLFSKLNKKYGKQVQIAKCKDK
tara:strand:- start:297 stop:788 length:492 start_codon:yes stop_codon:yes gene_type:complete